MEIVSRANRNDALKTTKTPSVFGRLLIESRGAAQTLGVLALGSECVNEIVANYEGGKYVSVI